MHDKVGNLMSILKGMDGIVVALSGGVDSALLLAAAKEAQGDRILAATARSATFTEEELGVARRIAEALGARHKVVETRELDDPRFRANAPDRCYRCKRERYRAFRALAVEEGLAGVVEGSNADDGADFRPGRRAANELGVRAPLAEAGLTKADVRALAREKGLDVWDRPASACLASRIPYGVEITEARLAGIARTEAAIRALGFAQVRVRDHGTTARIEVSPDDIPRFADPALRQKAVAEARKAGFAYVALDLDGYRTGALNEVLGVKERKGETP